jgi:transposase
MAAPARTASVVPDWKWVQVQSLRGGGAIKITTVGLDLAKSVFTVHGADEHGNTVLRKTVRRAKVLEVFA